MRFNDIRGDVEILGVVCQQHLLLVKRAQHVDTEHRSAVVCIADDMFDDVLPAFTMGLPVESFILALLNMILKSMCTPILSHPCLVA